MNTKPIAATVTKAGEVVAWESAVRLLQRCRQYICDGASDSDSDFIINDREHLLRALASICGEVASPPASMPSVEEMARAIDPQAFHEDYQTRYRYCDPWSIRVVQERAKSRAAAVLEILRTPAPVPAAEKPRSDDDAVRLAQRVEDFILSNDPFGDVFSQHDVENIRSQISGVSRKPPWDDCAVLPDAEERLTTALDALDGLYRLCMHANQGAFANSVVHNGIDEGEVRAAGFLDAARAVLPNEAQS